MSFSTTSAHNIDPVQDVNWRRVLELLREQTCEKFVFMTMAKDMCAQYANYIYFTVCTAANIVAFKRNLAAGISSSSTAAPELTAPDVIEAVQQTLPEDWRAGVEAHITEHLGWVFGDKTLHRGCFVQALAVIHPGTAPHSIRNSIPSSDPNSGQLALAAVMDDLLSELLDYIQTALAMHNSTTELELADEEQMPISAAVVEAAFKTDEDILRMWTEVTAKQIITVNLDAQDLCTDTEDGDRATYALEQTESNPEASAINLVVLITKCKKADHFLKGTQFSTKTARQQLVQDLDTMITMPLALNCTSVTEFDKYHPSLGGGKYWAGALFDNPKANRKVAMDVWNIFRIWPEALQRWLHVPENTDYMQKIIVHLEGPQLTTLPSIRMHGQVEDGVDADMDLVEEGRRDQVLVVTPTSARLKGHGEHKGSARDHGGIYQELSHFVAHVKSRLEKELGDAALVVQDLALLCLGSHTPDHVDEPRHDGGGNFIANSYLTSDGYFIFTGEGKDAPFVGTYVPSNSFSVFTGDMRYGCTHHVQHSLSPFPFFLSVSCSLGATHTPPIQVLRLDKPTKLDMTTETPGHGHRLVITMRFGHATTEGLEMYDNLFSPKFQVPC